MDIQQLSGSTLLIVTASDLQAFAESLLRDKPEVPAAPVVVNTRPMTQTASMDFLGVTRPTFMRLRKQGKIKGHTLGGKLYFFESELLEAIRKNDV